MSEHEIREPQGGSALTELSNAMVAMHREQFGRGPAAARAFLNESMAVCVLTDIYTRVERTLIDAGRLDHVKRTRLLHKQTLEDRYKAQAEAILGRKVLALMSAVNTEPDIAVDVFLLGERLGAAGNGAGEAGVTDGSGETAASGGEGATR